MLQLHRLLHTLRNASYNGPDSVDVADIAYDSRRVQPGALFVAIPQVGGDSESGGIRHAGEAVARGAVAVVTEAQHVIDGVPAIHVPDARAALADLAAEFYGHPSGQLWLYAVTGTDGKTTTTYLLEQILSHAGYRTGLIGTVELKIGNRRVANQERMTTPEALDVQRLLRAMVDAGVTHVAMEASSHALALQRLRACRFAACALTNVTADHIEFHGSWEEYFRAKASLFTDLAPAQPAVLNRDDPIFDRLATMVPAPMLTFGLEHGADIEALSVETHSTMSTGMLRYEKESSRFRIPLPGHYNVSNALAATGLALATGIPLEVAAAGLSAAQPPPGRMQRIAEGQPFEVLVDYAHTVHAFRSALATLRNQTPPPNRLIAVFGATGNRDRAKRPILAQVAREYADFFIITNEDPYREKAEEIIAQIAAGVPDSERGIRYDCEADRGAAIRTAIELARPGDTIAILGKGHEQSMVVDGQKEPWSDILTVRAVLGSLR